MKPGTIARAYRVAGVYRNPIDWNRTPDCVCFLDPGESALVLGLAQASSPNSPDSIKVLTRHGKVGYVHIGFLAEVNRP